MSAVQPTPRVKPAPADQPVPEVQPFAAFVGIDWEQRTHDVCLLPAAGGGPERTELPHKAETIAAWAAQLRTRFGGRPVAVCLEQARGPLVYALLQYEFLVLYPINPKQLADYRAALYPSGAKSDPADAELLARLLREHREQLRAWRPDDPQTRTLRLLVEQRRKWVQDRVALANELQQRLQESYPLAWELGRQNVCRKHFLDLLKKFPTQRELQRASPRQLEKWLSPRRRTSDEPAADELLRERIATLRAVPPITTDDAVLEHARLAIRHLVALIRTLQHAIAETDDQLDQRFAQHPDRELFSSFPGAGRSLAPRLAAAFGTDRKRFHDAAEIQQLSGIAPVTKASGKSKVVHMRWACPKFLRQTFHEFARCSIRRSRWAQAYVAMRRAYGHRYQAIIRGLAFKWQRILFRCWQAGKTYDESLYLKQLQAANSPLIRFLTPEPSNSP